MAAANTQLAAAMKERPAEDFDIEVGRCRLNL
jgi:hypothetical protein